MKTDSLSSPIDSTPEQKYAQLHRAMENGLVSGKARLELGRTCIDLKKFDEAVQVFRLLPSGQEKTHLHGLLKRAGVPVEEPPPNKWLPEHDLKRSVSEEVLDSFRFLFDDPMPVVIIVATVAFPVAMGIGGLLTLGASFILWKALALVPVLLVVGVVAVFCTRILRDAASGLEDAPRIPSPSVFLREVLPTLVRLAGLGTAAFLPAAVAITIGLPIVPTMGLILLGGILLPIAYHNLELTGKRSSLAPRTLLRTVVATRHDCPVVSAVVLALMMPCIALAVATIGSPLYVQIALFGCFFAAPCMIAARLLGRFHHRNDKALAFLLELPEAVAIEVPAGGPVVRRTNSQTDSTIRQALQRQSTRAENAPVQSPTTQAPTPRRAPAPAPRKVPAPVARPAAPAPARKAAPAAATPRTATPAERPAPATRRPAAAAPRPAPDTRRAAAAAPRPAPTTQRPASAGPRPAPATQRPTSAAPRPAPATQRPASVPPSGRPQMMGPHSAARLARFSGPRAATTPVARVPLGEPAEPVRQPTPAAPPGSRTTRVPPDRQRPAAQPAPALAPYNAPAAPAPTPAPTLTFGDEYPDLPGLANIPGLRIVKNAERVRVGASALDRPQTKSGRSAPASTTTTRVDGRPKSR